MTVAGGGLPAGVTIVTVTDTQNFVLSSTQTIPLNSALTYSNTYIFKLWPTVSDVPVDNSYLEGEYTDYVKVTNVVTSVESTTTTNNNAVTASTTFTLPAPGNNLILPGMTLSGTSLTVGHNLNI